MNDVNPNDNEKAGTPDENPSLHKTSQKPAAPMMKTPTPRTNGVDHQDDAS
jgi:hypothetical protein